MEHSWGYDVVADAGADNQFMKLKFKIIKVLLLL